MFATWKVYLIIGLVTGVTSYRDIKNPNIVFILTDDQDVVLEGMTPLKNTLSLIGKQGMTFTNMFTTSPLCCPSRSSILTGNYIHNHNAVNNSISGNCSSKSWQTGAENNTIATYLQDNGYKTFFIGKYLNQYGKTEAGGVAHVPLGWDEWNGLVGNSVYYNYTLSINGKAEKHGDDYKEDYLTDLINRRTNAFLAKQDPTSVPFFAMVSTPACHAPFDAAPQYMNNYANLSAPRTPSFDTVGKDKHWLIQQATNPMAASSITYLDDVFRKRWRTLLSVDDMVKDIIDTLTAQKILDETYIIFSSDNGYHLGQFSLPIDKRQLYEFDIRVPLLVRGPNVTAGTVTSIPALNIDIMPTIVDLAGVKDAPAVDGISLVPVLIPNTTAEATPTQRDVLIEHTGEFKPLGEANCTNSDYMAQCFPNCVCEDSMNNSYSCIRTITTSSNYIYCEMLDNQSFLEYYDMTKDPHQLTNAIQSLPKETQADIHKRLVKLELCQGICCHQVSSSSVYGEMNQVPVYLILPL